MATIASVVAGEVEIIEWPAAHEQDTKICAADIVGGTFVRQDASGNWIQALGTSTANLKGARYALRSAKTGQALTAARTGLYGGLTISQAFNTDVFISDTGTLADAAGTAGARVGGVESLNANQVSAAHDKGVRLDLPI